MARHSIGNFDFCVMVGQIPPHRETTEIIVRPGVSGTALRLTGLRGPVFNVVTIRDVRDLDSGQQLLDGYNSVIGASPMDIVKSDVDYFSQSGVLVAVLGVDPLQLQRASCIAGALDSGSEAILRVVWHLQLVSV
jgi:hypothetical protein